MDRTGTSITTPRTAGHYLKDELYSRVSSDPAIFEFIQAGSLDGIWYLDLEHPGEGWMSARYKELLGYQDHEVPNNSKWWRENALPEDLEPCLENFRRHCADPNYPFDQIVRHRHKNGSIVWVRCRGIAIRDSSGRPIRMLGAHTDITALKRTEERLRALNEASPDMYFVADLETGVLCECNHALVQTTGRENILGSTFLDLCDAASVETGKSIQAALRTQGEIKDIELEFRRKGGSSFTVLLTAKWVDLQERESRSFCAWCRDISHLRRFANMEVLLAALPSAALLADENGVISSSNPAADQLFGYRKGELTGKLLSTLLAGEASASELKAGLNLDLQGLRGDGGMFPIHLQISTLELGDGSFQVATVADMTVREDVEIALRESEHRFRQLTESLPQLVWTCTAEGTCDYLSPQWIEYTGIPAAAQLGLGWLEQVHPDDKDELLVTWSYSIRHGKEFHFDYRVRRHDGVYRWFDTRATPLRSVQNKIVKWFGSSTDIHERRETREELERERKRLANLVDLAPAVFCAFAIRQDGTAYFPFVTPAIEELLGIKADDLRRDASSILAILDPDELPGIRSSLDESAKAFSPWQMEIRVKHAARGARWIEAHSAPTPEPDGSISWYGFLQDITERKQAEDDQQFLLNLGTALQSAVSTQDIAEIATQTISVHFGVSRCSLRAIDAAHDEATLLHQYNRSGPSSKPGTRPLSSWMSKGQRELLQPGRIVAIENTAVNPLTKDQYASSFGPTQCEAFLSVPLRRGGKWVALLSLISNVPRQWTKREEDLAQSAAERIWPAYEAARALVAERAMHETLKASERRLQLALQSGAIGTWEHDETTREINWDIRSRAIFGFTADMPINNELVLACIHPEDRPAVDRSILLYQDPSGDGHFEADYRVITWNGMGVRHVLAQGQMFFEGEGENRRPVRTVGTLQDVTALKKGEQALRRVNQELEQFAYAAAHDLQEPLRNVGLATQILASRYRGQLDGEAEGLLQVAVDGPIRMQAMVKDLLAYSRALTSEEGQVLLADANLVLAVVLKNLLVSIEEKQAEVTWQPLPKVQMSEVHLTQIFQNLISNSLKYSGPTVPKIHIAAHYEAGECVFAVQDNGLGIPPNYHQRAFGVFKRLHSRDIPGTGIGLALCKRIVEHYGGRIWIESDTNQGAKILFTVMLAEAEPRSS